jgi:hypothetical protein
LPLHELAVLMDYVDKEVPFLHRKVLQNMDYLPTGMKCLIEEVLQAMQR